MLALSQPYQNQATAVRTCDHRVEPGAAIDLDAIPTRLDVTGPEQDPAPLSKRRLARALGKKVRQFSRLQELLYAEGRQALLLVFQGMDAAGKDSAIKRVTSGVNPQGFRVTNFNRPTALELQHTWLHRHWLALPERGRIGIFNRSHYEEVVTLRVHPELLTSRNLPDERIDEAFWNGRLTDIVAFEDHLVRNGTSVLKFFLHVSRDEQRRRLTQRLKDPRKHWKFDASDLEARRHWAAYRTAYEAAFQATSTGSAPWYVIPADDKPAARLLLATIIVETLTAMAPRLPEAAKPEIPDTAMLA